MLLLRTVKPFRDQLVILGYIKTLSALLVFVSDPFWACVL